MSYLFLYLGITVIGYLIGAKMRKRGVGLPWVGRVQTLMIIVLVFLMGSRIGSNEEIVSSLGTIGLVSLAYTLIIFAVTVAAATVARRLLGFDRYGIRRGKRSAAAGARVSETPGDAAAAGAPVSEAAQDAEAGAPGAGASAGMAPAESSDSAPAAETSEDGAAGTPRINWLTVMIVVFVSIGIVCGYTFLPEGFIAVTGTLLTISLCILLVFIGIDIGTAGTLGENFRSAGWRVLVFPFVSMFAMMVGSVIAGVLLPMSVQDGLCVGSGFAWYSLAPVMLAEYSTRVSAISFMHNVFREILGMLLISPVAKRIGYIECYSLPGSTSMDVCLPIIERATSSDVAVYSFINGAIISASVPVWVTIFMNL